MALTKLKNNKKKGKNSYDISYPVLTKLPNAAITQSINKQISEHSKTACEGSGDYNLTAEVTLLNAVVFSYKGSEDFDCEGAAHPNSSPYGTSYDLRDGKGLDLQDVLLIKDAAQKQKLAKIVAAGIKKDPPMDECIDPYSDKELPDMSYNFYFDAEQNLILLPQLPHAIENCEQDIKLSKTQLGSLINPNGVMAKF